jgi:hypothetical protein
MPQFSATKHGVKDLVLFDMAPLGRNACTMSSTHLYKIKPIFEPCKITLENCKIFPKLLSWSIKKQDYSCKSGAMISTIMVGNKA